MFQPIDELFDQRVDAGATGIKPDVRLFVGCTTLIIQAFEPGAIRSQRTASIGRDPVDQPVQGHVQPNGHPVRVDRRPVLAVDKGPSAGGDHQVTPRNLVHQRLALDCTEISFALAGKDVGDGLTLPLLNDLVDVHELPTQSAGQGPGDGRLSGGHEPDQVNLVFHPTNRPNVSKNPGYEIATASEPSIVEGRSAESAAIANAIAIR